MNNVPNPNDIVFPGIRNLVTRLFDAAKRDDAQLVANHVKDHDDHYTAWLGQDMSYVGLFEHLRYVYKHNHLENDVSQTRYMIKLWLSARNLSSASTVFLAQISESKTSGRKKIAHVAGEALLYGQLLSHMQALLTNPDGPPQPDKTMTMAMRDAYAAMNPRLAVKLVPDISYEEFWAVGRGETSVCAVKGRYRVFPSPSQKIGQEAWSDNEDQTS